MTCLRISKLFTYVLVILLIPYYCSGQSIDINGQKFPNKYREFDFWIGEWDVNLRKPNNSFEHHDWKESKAKIYSILDGRAILELWEEKWGANPSSTIIGYSLRYYNPDRKEWTLWLNWPGVNRSGSQQLSGKFRHGRGEFFRKDPVNDSVSNISRYTFSDITAQSLRWDGSNSIDNGRTWMAGWIMEFSRTKNRADWPEGDTLHTFQDGGRCNLKEFGDLERLVGRWEGQGKTINKNGEWSDVKLTISNYRALGGCSVMSFLEMKEGASPSFKEFSLFTFNTYANKFEDGRLSNDPESVYRAFYGDMNEDYLELAHRDQTTGEIVEKYRWQVRKNKLFVEKYELLNGEMKKVMDGQLKAK